MGVLGASYLSCNPSPVPDTARAPCLPVVGRPAGRPTCYALGAACWAHPGQPMIRPRMSGATVAIFWRRPSRICVPTTTGHLYTHGLRRLPRPLPAPPRPAVPRWPFAAPLGAKAIPGCCSGRGCDRARREVPPHKREPRSTCSHAPSPLPGRIRQAPTNGNRPAPAPYSRNQAPVRGIPCPPRQAPASGPARLPRNQGRSGGRGAAGLVGRPAPARNAWLANLPPWCPGPRKSRVSVPCGPAATACPRKCAQNGHNRNMAWGAGGSLNRLA